MSATPLVEVADLRTLWVRVPVYAGDSSALGGVREVVGERPRARLDGWPASWHDV